MCGICGIVQRHGSFDIRQEMLQRMNDVISHRGPDDEGYYLTPSIGLAMRRLSIIDLAGGHQPIQNEDGSVQVVFNGEIYNFPELRNTLEECGHRFSTQADTEVIVHGYEEYGIDVVHHLRGMFAFALWDENKEHLLLVRDRPGIKPLHYYCDDEKFLFGSEIKAILQCERVPRDVNLDALDRFLTFEYIFSPETIFTGIHKLPPGHLLILPKNGDMRIEQYWDNLPTEPDRQKDEEFYVQRLAELLEESVKMRLISDVPLGALLSGGVDSSTVVGFMAKHSSKPVKTFSIGFEDQSYNELEYARIVSKRFNTEHYEFIIKPDAVDLVERLVKNLDEPFGDFSIFPTYLVSKMAREYVTVALSGDGGDELFAGYDTYIADRVARGYQKLPAIFRKQVLPGLLQHIPPSPRKKGLINRTKRFVEGTLLPEELMHTRWMIFLQDQEKRQLYANDLLQIFEQGNSYKYIRKYFGRSRGVSPLARQEYVDIKTYLTDDILVKVDRMSMAPSLETRVPFLDHKVMEFAATIPTSLKLKGLTTKYVLKKAVADLLPQEILTRGKEGFSIPIKNWIMQELRPLLLDTLSEKRIKQRGYFQPQYVQHLIQEHLDGKENHSHRLWALMMVEIWHQVYLD